MGNITPEMARRELARRELERRQKQTGEQDNENILQKIVRYGIKDPAIGVLNMGREFANLPHKVSGGKIPEFSPSDFSFEKTLGVEHPDTADKLVQFAGQYGPSMVLPEMALGKAGTAIAAIPKVGRFAKRAVGEAIPQALYSAAQAPSNQAKAAAESAGTMVPFSVLGELMRSTNPAVRNIAKGVAGAASAYLGREGAKAAGFGEAGSDVAALAAGALGARGFGTKKEMMRKLTEGVNPEMAEERIKAAKKIGLDYLTPAEAGVSPWAAKRQGSLGRTEEGARMLYEKGMARRNSERDAINTVLNQIYSPEKMDAKVKEAYKAIGDVNLPPDFILKNKDNHIINRAEEMVKKSPAYQESLKELLPENVKLKPGQSDIQPTSLVYWDHVKRAMDDMVNTAERQGSKNEARIISETRSRLRDDMDASFPEYAQARALYERKMTRQGLEKVFDQKEINGTNFYRALASQKRFDELMGHLKNAPEARENLKAMRMLFKDLMGPPTIKTAKGTEERGMNQSRSTGAFLESLMDSVFTKGANDKAAIQFITSKDWLKQLEDINKISDKQMKMVALAMGLSRGIAQAAGKQE